MTGLRVTPEQLQSLSGRAKATSADIESTLRRLSSELAPLGSDWAGIAQQRFQELYAQWQTGADQLNQALAGIGDLLSRAGLAYREAEDSVARSFAVG